MSALQVMSADQLADALDVHAVGQRQHTSRTVRERIAMDWRCWSAFADRHGKQRFPMTASLLKSFRIECTVRGLSSKRIKSYRQTLGQVHVMMNIPFVWVTTDLAGLWPAPEPVPPPIQPARRGRREPARLRWPRPQKFKVDAVVAAAPSEAVAGEILAVTQVAVRAPAREVHSEPLSRSVFEAAGQSLDKLKVCLEQSAIDSKRRSSTELFSVISAIDYIADAREDLVDISPASRSAGRWKLPPFDEGVAELSVAFDRLQCWHDAMADLCGQGVLKTVNDVRSAKYCLMRTSLAIGSLREALI